MLVTSGIHHYRTDIQQQQQNAMAYNSQQQYPNSNQRQPAQLLAPTKASVPRYCFADEIFWFIVECQMEDGRHWELSRLYQDFYDLQINLIQEHPLEAGNVKGVERSLPYMPGPVTYVTDNISNGRRANLDEYIRNLLRLGPHITRGGLVRAFFAPREGDYEIDPNQPVDYRLSAGSQDSPANPSATASPQSSAGNLSGGQQAQGGMYGQQQPQRPGQGHYRTGSQATTTSPPLGQRTNTSAGATAMKIKVWFESDSCVVIRMPPQFRYDELYKKLKDRRALERIDGDVKDPDNVVLEVMYRDEGESRLFPIRNDEELKVAMERNERLTLNVRAR
jgi:bud emergence protein 1